MSSMKPRLRVVCAIALLFAASCSRPSQAVEASSAASPSVEASSARALASPREDLPGLPNFAKVSEGLYRGAQPTAEGFRTLRALGVKTVVSLRWLHSDRALLAGTGLRYFRIEAKAWHPEDEDVARALKIIEAPENRPVFVHCQHGADRTGTVVAAYRIVEEGWSREEAASELPRFGYHPIWTEVLDYLKRFDRTAMRRTIDETPAPKLDVVR
jgi:protein tyrosine/serine phosphatase